MGAKINEKIRVAFSGLRVSLDKGVVVTEDLKTLGCLCAT